MSRYSRDIPPLAADDALSIRRSLEEDAARRQSFFPEEPLRILVGNQYRGSLDPTKRQKFRHKMDENSCWVEVQARAGGADLLLAAFFYRYDELLEGGRKRKFSTVLEGGQEIVFTTHFKATAGGGWRPVIDISYRETKIFRALLLLWRQFKNALQGLVSPPAGQPHPVFALLAALASPRIIYPSAFACLLLMVTGLYLRDRAHREAIEVASRTRPTDGAVVIPAEADGGRIAGPARLSPPSAPGVNVEPASGGPPPDTRAALEPSRHGSRRAEVRSTRAVTLPRRVVEPSDTTRSMHLSSVTSTLYNYRALPQPTPTQLLPEIRALSEQSSAISLSRPYAAGTLNAGPGVTSRLEGTVLHRSASAFVLDSQEHSAAWVGLDDSTEVNDREGLQQGDARYAMTRLLPGTYVDVQAFRKDSGELIARTVSLSRPRAAEDLRGAAASPAVADPPPLGAKRRSSVFGFSAPTGRAAGNRPDIQRRIVRPRGGGGAARFTARRELGFEYAERKRLESSVVPATLVSELRPYVLRETISIPFEPGGASLLPEAAGRLEAGSRKVGPDSDYMIHVVGFTGPQVDDEKRGRLIRRRTDVVVANLIESQKVPLRRVVTPLDSRPELKGTSQREDSEVGDDRVEVRVLHRRPAP